MNIIATKKRLDAKIAGRMYRSFIKATENMAEDKRNEVIDSHVMGYVHHLLHDITDRSKDHVAAGEAMAAADQQKASSKTQQDNMAQQIKVILTKIVKEFAGFKISNPEKIPHVYHMVEHHPKLQEVIMGIAKHQITVDTGVKKVLQEIAQEKKHDRYDVSATHFEKSSGGMFGMFGAYSFPSYPIAFSSSAMSRFRPSPPFLKDTTECPDERFIKMLMKTKYDGEDEETRPAEPIDNSHETLAERAGVPHHLIAGNVQKACANVRHIKAKLKDTINRNKFDKATTITERMDEDEVFKGGRAHSIRKK